MRHRSAFALLSCVALLGCSKKDQLRVADVPQDWFNAPLILALKGWQGKPPLPDMISFALTSGLASKTAVAGGNADVGLASPVVLLRDPTSIKHIRVLGCYMRSDTVLGIASKSAKPQPPFAFVRGTISEVFLARYFNKLGQGEAYRAGQIATVALLPPAAAVALKSGADGKSVNSVVIWEPHLSRAAGEVHGKVVLDPSVYRVNVCLIANRQAYASSLKPKIDAFAREVGAASLYIAAHSDDARTTIEKEAGLPEGALKTAWARADFHMETRPDQLQTMLDAEVRAIDEAHMSVGKIDAADLLR